ncbi:hypothetical protein AMS68_002225 [Peltaster fructicola]|uniref:Uncharacterized protein n=1 Tax=Peltaster fructicola TaxID=286661 RepID=A0A6H0XPZ7_9PEZI|nr:hypothetical protein AMS68_002225 [Peltaster fructicola]
MFDPIVKKATSELKDSSSYFADRALEILNVLKDCGYDEAATSDVVSQLRHIMSTHGTFDRAYLHDQTRLALYEQIAAVVRLMDTNNIVVNTTRGLRASVGQRSQHLCEHFLRAAASPLIDSEATTCFRRKWEVLVTMVAVQDRHDREGRQLLMWYNIDDRMPKLQHFAKEATTAYPTINAKQDMIAVLYLTGIAVVINICFFAVAFSYSSSEPGTSHDADFWLMWQSTLTQVLSFAVVGYSLWNDRSLPRWYWMAPVVTAYTCSLGAIPMYVHLPVGWSALLTTISSTVQAFITLQLALMVNK